MSRKRTNRVLVSHLEQSKYKGTRQKTCSLRHRTTTLTRVRRLSRSCILLTSAHIVFHGSYLVYADNLCEGWGKKPAKPQPCHHSGRKRKHGDPSSHALAYAPLSV